MNKRSGFTLMEMLIVIAIIAVLVAIAIPVFTSQVAAARTASCQANQRNMKAAVSAAYMSNGQNKAAAAAEGVSAMGLDPSDLKGADPVYTIGADSLCPEAGTYTITFNEASVDVTCSKHSASSLLGQDEAVMETLGTELLKFGQCDSAGSYSGSAGITQQLLSALKDEGIDLEAMGATSWAWRPDASYPKLYWSSVDIGDSSMTGKSGVPLMSYNPKTKSYMVYKGTVGTRSGDGANVYSVFSKVSKQGETFEDAYARYLDLMKDQGYN